MDDMRKMAQGVHGPSYCWLNAKRLAEASSSALKRRSFWHDADLVTRAAAEYIRCCSQGSRDKQIAAKTYPAIAAAEAAWNSPPIRDQLKILIIGDCPQEEIAQLCKISPEAVDAVERLFYDVRGSRKALGWIRSAVIEPEISAGNGALASKLKLALCAGPVAARLVLTSDVQLPVASADRLLRQKLQLQLKADQALAMPLDTSRDSIRYLKIYVDMDLAEQRLRLAERKLQYRCEEALRRAEVAKYRLERVTKREERLAAQKAAKEEKRCAEAARFERDWIASSQAELAQERARQELAIGSPLAQLTWHSSAATQSVEQEFAMVGVDGRPEPAPRTTKPRRNRHGQRPLPEFNRAALGGDGNGELVVVADKRKAFCA
jgi:hypothetical protein